LVTQCNEADDTTYYELAKFLEATQRKAGRFLRTHIDNRLHVKSITVDGSMPD